MRQADAHDVSEPIPVIISPIASLQLELSAENRTSPDDSNSTNSFADGQQTEFRPLDTTDERA
eukprot:6024254-Pyramimonas_sp.AAC.1